MSTLSAVERSRAAESLYAVGHGLFEREKYGDALRIFRALVLAAPLDERAWLGLGLCKERLGDTNTALALYAMGAMAAPSAARCCLAAARLLHERGDDSAADAALEQADEVALRTRCDDLMNVIRTMRGVR